MSLLSTEEDGASTGGGATSATGGATSATGKGSRGLFGAGFCEVKLTSGRSEPGTE